MDCVLGFGLSGKENKIKKKDSIWSPFSLCGDNEKSFTQFFSKNCGFPKGKALGRTPQSAKHFIRTSAFSEV